MRKYNALHPERLKQNRKTTDRRRATNVNRRIAAYKFACGQRGRFWRLTDQEAEWFFTRNCHYCGSPPPKDNLNGLDRIDNDVQGYDIDTIVPCCAFCNYSKRSKSYEEFVAYLDRVALYRTRTKEDE